MFARTPDTHIGRRPIFFLHVPKTAGTAVRHFLEAPLRRDETYRVMSVPNEIQRRRRERFNPNVKFVSGHVPYWFGDALPGRQVLLFARNPVERVLSTYYFWRNQHAPAPEDLSPDAELLRAIAKTSLEEFVFDTGAIWHGAINNYACRMVGHAQPWSLDLPYDVETEKLALERVESIEMVGVVERTNESLAVIARHLGLPFESPLPSQNVTIGRPKAVDTSHDVIAAIQDANEGDILLWERANAELDKRAQAPKSFSFFKTRLADIEGKFAPQATEKGLTLRMAEQPVLGSGWLAPCFKHDKSWRFCACRGPASLYVELPRGSSLSMVIECPYAASAFNFSKLDIRIDGLPLAYEVVPALERVTIFTSPFKVKQWRRLTRIVFDYIEPPSEGGEGSAEHDGAFAISSITWTPSVEGSPAMAWPNVRSMTDLIGEDRALLVAKRDEAVDYVHSLQAVIASRDEYIASLSTAMEEKDRYTISLLAAIDEKDRHAGAMVSTLVDKDTYAASLLTALDEKDNYISSLSAAISEKDAYVASLIDAIEQKDSYASELHLLLERKEDEVRALHAGVDREQVSSAAA